MHDSQLEEQLRGVLRAEGDGIPLTITTAELERRLATRRRATGGRRLSWVAAAVAAAVVVSIVAAGNGWLKLPAVGTVPSPSPSVEPSAQSVTRLERGDGDLILEIEPTWSGPGANPSIEKQLVPTDFVVSIRVACVGSGVVTFEERDHAVSEPCEKDASVPRAPGEPIAHRIPTSDGYLSVRFTVSAAINYTILVETIPLPDRLPALSTPDGIVDIDANSDSDRPATGMPGTTRSLSIGVVPASPTQRLAMVCLGSGVLQYTLASAAEPDSAITGEIVCDGVAELDEFSVDAAAAHDLRIKTEVRTAWHVMASHDDLKSASPTNQPSGRAPLGEPGQAILIQPIGASWTTPDSLVVTRYDPSDQTSVVIATIPGSVVPAGTWISTGTKPVVSATGWLAIPIQPGPDATDRQPEVVIVDLLDPTAAPKSIAGVSSGSWSPDDTFAAIADGGIQLYHPATGALEVSPIQDPAVSVATLTPATLGPAGNDPIWTNASDSRFLGIRDAGAATTDGSQGWGVISANGSFSPTSDLPPVFQRTGLERPVGAGTHQFMIACTGSGITPEAGCSLAEIDASGARIATRVNATDYPYLADAAWTANGRDAWLLFGTAPDGGRGADGNVSVSLSKPDGSRQEYSAIHVSGGNFAFLGASQSADGLPIVAIGSRDSWLRTFVAARGGPLNAGSPGTGIGTDETSWFAGWAGQQPDYDPD